MTKAYNWNDNVEIPLTGINVGNHGRVWNTSDMASLKVFDDESPEPSTDAARWPIPLKDHEV
jgi:hypothetical protein